MDYEQYREKLKSEWDLAVISDDFRMADDSTQQTE